MATVQLSVSQGQNKFMAFFRFIGAIVSYIVSGKWIVDLVRWLVTTGGNVAESAFILATVYVTINTVAHPLMTWVLPESNILTLNQISVVAFSVLPELIIFSALKVTYDHWKMVAATKRIDAWVWAILYTIPTLIFLVMTIITITSFVSVESINAAVSPLASGWMLVTRCLAGWGYGMIQMLFSKIGQPGYSEVYDRLSDDITGLNETLGLRDATIAALQSDLTNLQEQFATQRDELISLRVALANKKVAQRHQKSNSSDENVISENATSLQGDNATVSLVTEKQQRIKDHLQQAIIKGEKLNLKKIAADAGVSYGLVRKHASGIIEGLSDERNTEHLSRVSA